MALHNTSGSGAPATTPTKVGQHYTDTLNGDAYLSVGTASSADWMLVQDSAALGTIATQDANAVAITGGSITGITDLAIADGGTGASTATAAFDGLSPTTTAGDLIFNNGTNDVRLGIGTAGQVLTVNAGATAPEWASGATGGSAGRHAIWIAAGSITPSASGGCAALATIASAANQPDIQTLDFDATTQEYAQFSIRMPKSWDEGTVTFAPVWSHAATVTNFGVVWDLQLVAVSDDDGIAVAFGTAQTSTDTGGTTNDIYIGPESSAITVSGTPASEDIVFGRISRVTGDGGDTMAVDARLHGITLYVTTNAETDA